MNYLKAAESNKFLPVYSVSCLLPAWYQKLDQTFVSGMCKDTNVILMSLDVFIRDGPDAFWMLART